MRSSFGRRASFFYIACVLISTITKITIDGFNNKAIQPFHGLHSTIISRGYQRSRSISTTKDGYISRIQSTRDSQDPERKIPKFLSKATLNKADSDIPGKAPPSSSSSSAKSSKGKNAEEVVVSLDSSNDDAGDGVEAKKSRGRPKSKSMASALEMLSGISEDGDAIPAEPKKGRGRPRKATDDSTSKAKKTTPLQKASLKVEGMGKEAASGLMKNGKNPFKSLSSDSEGSVNFKDFDTKDLKDILPNFEEDFKSLEADLGDIEDFDFNDLDDELINSAILNDIALGADSGLEDDQLIADILASRGSGKGAMGVAGGKDADTAFDIDLLLKEFGGEATDDKGSEKKSKPSPNKAPAGNRGFANDDDDDEEMEPPMLGEDVDLELLDSLSLLDANDQLLAAVRDDDEDLELDLMTITADSSIEEDDDDDDDDVDEEEHEKEEEIVEKLAVTTRGRKGKPEVKAGRTRSTIENALSELKLTPDELSDDLGAEPPPIEEFKKLMESLGSESMFDETYLDDEGEFEEDDLPEIKRQLALAYENMTTRDAAWRQLIYEGGKTPSRIPTMEEMRAAYPDQSDENNELDIQAIKNWVDDHVTPQRHRVTLVAAVTNSSLNSTALEMVERVYEHIRQGTNNDDRIAYQTICYNHHDGSPYEEIDDMVQMWLESYNTYHIVDGKAMKEAWGAIMPHVMLSQKNLDAIVEQVRWALLEDESGAAILSPRMRRIRFRGGAQEMITGYNTEFLDQEFSVVSVR